MGRFRTLGQGYDGELPGTRMVSPMVRTYGVSRWYAYSVRKSRAST